MLITPEPLSSKSEAVNAAAPLVEPSAAALLMPIVPLVVIVPPVIGEVVAIEVTVPEPLAGAWLTQSVPLYVNTSPAIGGVVIKSTS